MKHTSAKKRFNQSFVLRNRAFGDLGLEKVRIISFLVEIVNMDLEEALDLTMVLVWNSVFDLFILNRMDLSVVILLMKI